MSSEIEQLEREIAERTARLAELKRNAVTRDELRQMTPQQVRALDPALVDQALAEK